MENRLRVENVFLQRLESLLQPLHGRRPVSLSSHSLDKYSSFLRSLRYNILTDRPPFSPRTHSPKIWDKRYKKLQFLMSPVKKSWWCINCKILVKFSVLVRWCSGYHVCFTRRRSRVRTPNEPFLPYFVFFLKQETHTIMQYISSFCFFEESPALFGIHSHLLA